MHCCGVLTYGALIGTICRPAEHAATHRFCPAPPDAATHLPVERLDLAKIGSFEFRAPDDVRCPALRLAREVMARGGWPCGVQAAQRGWRWMAFRRRQTAFSANAQIGPKTNGNHFS